MSKIKLSNQEIEKLAYLAVKKSDMDEPLNVKCRKLAEEYAQAKKFLAKLNGDKIEKPKAIEEESLSPME